MISYSESMLYDARMRIIRVLLFMFVVMIRVPLLIDNSPQL